MIDGVDTDAGGPCLVRLEWHRLPAADCVAVSGEVDLACIDLFRNGLLYALRPGRPLVVDLGAVGFIDVLGLTALAEVDRRAAGLGSALRVRSASPFTRRLLRLTGLAEVLE